MDGVNSRSSTQNLCVRSVEHAPSTTGLLEDDRHAVAFPDIPPKPAASATRDTDECEIQRQRASIANRESRLTPTETEHYRAKSVQRDTRVKVVLPSLESVEIQPRNENQNHALRAVRVSTTISVATLQLP